MKKRTTIQAILQHYIFPLVLLLSFGVFQASEYYSPVLKSSWHTSQLDVDLEKDVKEEGDKEGDTFVTTHWLNVAANAPINPKGTTHSVNIFYQMPHLQVFSPPPEQS